MRLVSIVVLRGRRIEHDFLAHVPEISRASRVGWPARRAISLSRHADRSRPEAETLEAIPTADVSPSLADVAVPTLVLVGTEDRRTPPAISRGLAEAISSSVLREIQGAGQLALLDELEAFVRQLEQFLLGLAA